MSEPSDEQKNEGYPSHWKHATIHLDPRTGEIHSIGDPNMGCLFRHAFVLAGEKSKNLHEVYEELCGWINELGRGIEAGPETIWENEKSGTVHIRFYTETQEYAIVARPPTEMGVGYLGCMATSRKRRPGESWHRGRDLPDGPYCRDIWDRILRGILAYEILPKPASTVKETIEQSHNTSSK